MKSWAWRTSSRSVYDNFGFTYHVELSTRPEDSMGSDEDWEAAEQGLKTALDKLGMDYVINEGNGAFYGPKGPLPVGRLPGPYVAVRHRCSSTSRCR